jgi:hypothetical protein
MRADENIAIPGAEADEAEGHPDSGLGRQVYRSPRLTLLGDIRGLTLGGSRVVRDSATALRRIPV